ncbi:helix-turn-helix transcriptional regulator [Roseicitreum antarcticum]|uniref:helix-turn-helix transcriptional regulator n=1 Tax=Roseicitreum antarcticum TaxID=564137 RepID=UPI000B87D87F
MNTLSAYLSREGIRQGDFAKRVGLTQATVSRLARNAMRPRLETALTIERATGGAVPVSSWGQSEDAA